MFLITRRDNLCPKTGLEPVIALLEGKCLNHLNYSGSYNCCTRLLGKEVYIRSVGASNGTRTRAVCLASRNTNRLYYTCIWVREPAEPLAHLICIYLERDSQVYPLEAKTGIEPATCWVQISCTASCATWPSGPGNGNRTRVFCLEGRHSTIELHRDVRLISQPIV